MAGGEDKDGDEGRRHGQDTAHLLPDTGTAGSGRGGATVLGQWRSHVPSVCCSCCFSCVYVVLRE